MAEGVKGFEKIRDPRNPKFIRRKLTFLVLCEILAFDCHAANRLSASMDVNHIEEAFLAPIERFIRGKKLRHCRTTRRKRSRLLAWD